MNKIISATLFFIISVFLAWFTVDAAVITAYGTIAGGELAHCSVTFNPHKQNESYLDSTWSIPDGNPARR
jgi:hypothetical protein